ncbi:biotin-dependent carboxyltransferase family protein [Demequina globuliformis]|uniref:5-oxoprolinase subunit C family protein n=1 Tax=Demequina globuliformis TaxID=676202 RepID=UPI000781E7AC|nr:biotin-dependent carboxyltransferase family protein [Demequina globuliformis]
MIEVVDPGALLTVQDNGRRGYAHVGVSPSGWCDPLAARAANAAVGNPRGSAVLEATLTGTVLRTREPAVVAVTGARAGVYVGDVPAPLGRPLRLRSGQTLEVTPAEAGLRSYIAVRGGIAVPPVLGSRSTDVLSGLGPAPLKAGDRVPVGEASPAPADLFGAGETPPHVAGPHEQVTLVLDPGPRPDWVREWGEWAAQVFTASAHSNRIGLRLEGATVPWAREGELASEGLVAGAVQVPPSGEPVVFLADHPTTGGYPVIGVLDAASLSLAAQVRPGQPVILRRSH